MAALSPLPRWAPTPSPTRPLRTPGTPIAGTTATSTWRCCLPSITCTFVFGAARALRGLPGGEPPAVLPDGSHCVDHQSGHRGCIAPLDGVEAVVDRPKEEMVTNACSRRGVFLTWDDLSVTAPAAGSRKSRAVILDGLGGYARPGEMLALMGPSGCGKTTLLDALAGRLSPNMKMRGDILINGRREKLAFGTSAYVTQENMLMATLTVTEAVRYSAQLQLPDSMSLAEKRAHADRAIRQMGLAAVADVRIGGRVCKGISGGQRKRVSICVELLASPALLFLDEPTSGLDSAASFHVMSRIAGIARRDGMTVVAAVHQPSSEVFELFHGLCLLASGRTVYFGPVSDAIEFFDANGFPCPLRRNPSDHFLRMINKDFEESEEGSTIISPRAADVIQTLMGSLKSRGGLRAEKEACATIEKGTSLIPQRQATFLTKTFVLTKRSIVNMHRDAGYYWLRFVIYIAICLSIGTIFFNVGSNFASIQARASMLMFTSTLLTMMAIGGFPSFVEDMKIFRKERMSGHYGATEFVISNTLSSSPYLGLISIIPGAIAYYLTGLQRGIDHFIYFAAVLWACTMLVEGLMMIVAAIVPDFLLGIIAGSGVQGVLMLNAGFFRLPSDLPKPVWKYPTYFISYHKYATQGLYKNELLGLVFEDIGGGGLTISGEYILNNYLEVELSYSKWVDLAILVTMIIIYRVLFLVIIKISEIVKPRMFHFLCASKFTLLNYLALMGPSGCGKTTLLDALAGRLSPNMKMRGDILINGRREKLAFGTSAYVTQENMLMATLTVTEAVRYSAQLQLPDSMSLAEKRAHADRAIRQMGLAAVADVRIGGRVCKGISGGQRKRVSICVELLASPALLFLDEPTSGLDSAASFHVMSRIAGIARRDGMTVVAAVHQPSSEVFELFHGLCLLASGRTVYFGPVSDAIEFFDANGFPCPLRRNPSDHFLRMINKDFEESEEGSTIISPRAADVIQTLMGSLKSRGGLRAEKEACATIEKGTSLIPQRQATFLTKTFVLTKRSIVNMHRDAGYYWLRFVIYIAICLSIGTIFFNVGSNFASIQARASMLMFTSTLLTMMAIGGFPSFVEDMKIFRKERMSGHYGATEFVISNTLSSSPYLGLISIIPGAIAYYLTGLQRGIDHFIYFAAVLWACTMLVEGLMMIVAAIVPDFLLGIIAGSGVQGVLMLNAGFFRLPSDLPKPVWKYPTYFISYHKYATQGLYKNELLGLVFEDIGGGGLTISGEYILNNYLEVELSYSKWVDLAILVTMIIIYRVLFLVIIKISEIVKPRMFHFLCASKFTLLNYLALMGPSGCGKTTLLDALAGRLSPNMKMRGDILINGRREKLAFGTSAYVTQENMLMATLTVTEAVRYSAQLQLPDSMSLAEKRAHADRAIRQMGLAAVADVRIGGRVCKGISGGQRKRVSICVELLASPALLFLDEPTSGLDSAASFHVMSRIAGIARRDGMTVVAAVHQPSSEVFELFHGLCLLASGRTVYFGPVSDAIEFFDANGFPCPLRRNPSDHFLRMINKDFEESEEGSTIISPRAADVIQTLMGSLKSRGGLRAEKEACAMIEKGTSLIPQRQATFLTKTFVLTKRSIVNMHRDAGYYWLRFVIYIAICLSIGTIFFNVGSNFASIHARASMLMFTSTLLTMMAIGGFPSFVEDMKIFRKERMSGHYGATEFVISNTLSSSPYLGLISIIPGAIAYYLTGLQRGIDHFIYFAAVLWACTMLVEGLMMIVAAIVPDFLLGIIAGSGVQGVLMLNAGFFRLPSDLPKPVWKYPTYFISYHKYATQGLYKNELLGLVFEDIGGGGLTISGEYILNNYLEVELSYSKWVDLAILVTMIIIYRVLFLVIIKISEIVKPRMFHFLCASKV